MTDSSGLSLVTEEGMQRHVLTRAACLALARALLSTVQALPRECDPAVRAWAAHHETEPLAARLQRAVVVERTSPESLTVEAAVLLDAIAASGRHRALADRFDAAVAAARLEALRELAYGAGHEINNPLANIAARAQALLVEEQDPDRRRKLSTIAEQSFRARDMIGGLMVFAKPPRARRAPIAVDALVQPVLHSFRTAVASRPVRMDYSPPPTPVTVVVDRHQVEEAIRAIVANAIEAVDDGGHVTVAARHAVNGREPGAELTVTDDGRGMDADVLRRAFDPFFSGRDAGRGIGLGLPKAWRLVEANGGEVHVDSASGRGTTVRIRLPGAETSAETATEMPSGRR